MPRHKRVYAYKSCLFIPRIELKLNFFLYPVKEKVKEGKIADGGVLLSLSLFLSVESRSDTEEIEWKSRRARRCNSEAT